MTPLQHLTRKSPEQRRREANQWRTARAIIGAVIVFVIMPFMFIGCPALTLWVMRIGQ